MSISARCSVVPGEVQGRYRRDVGEMWGRCGGDVGEIESVESARWRARGDARDAAAQILVHLVRVTP